MFTQFFNWYDQRHDYAREWLAKNGVEKTKKISFKNYMNPEA